MPLVVPMSDRALETTKKPFRSKWDLPALILLYLVGWINGVIFMLPG